MRDDYGSWDIVWDAVKSKTTNFMEFLEFNLKIFFPFYQCYFKGQDILNNNSRWCVTVRVCDECCCCMVVFFNLCFTSLYTAGAFLPRGGCILAGGLNDIYVYSYLYQLTLSSDLGSFEMKGAVYE